MYFTPDNRSAELTRGAELAGHPVDAGSVTIRAFPGECRDRTSNVLKKLQKRTLAAKKGRKLVPLFMPAAA